MEGGEGGEGRKVGGKRELLCAGQGDGPAGGEAFFDCPDFEAAAGGFRGVVGDAGFAAFCGGEVGADGAVFEELGEKVDGFVDGVGIVVWGGDELVGGEGGGAAPVEVERGAGGGDAEAQCRGVRGEVIFADGDDAIVWGGGVGGDDEGGAGDGGEGDGAGAAVEGFGAGGFGEVADADDGDVGRFGEGGQGIQDEADVLVAVGVDGGGEDGHDGID